MFVLHKLTVSVFGDNKTRGIIKTVNSHKDLIIKLRINT